MSSNAEMALATIYAKPEKCYEYICEQNIFNPEDFDTSFRPIFIGFYSILQKYKTLNYELVFDYVQKNKLSWKMFSDTLNLFEGKDTVPSVLPEIAKELKTEATRRKIFTLSENIRALSDKKNLTSSELATEVFALCSQLNIVQDTDPQSVFTVFQELLKDLKDNSDTAEFIPTGYSLLDEKIKGLFKGGLNIIGARSGVGKSAFLINLVLKILSRKDVTKPCLLFSLEMPNKQVLSRLLCLAGRLRHDDLIEHRIGAEHYQRILATLQQMANMKDGKVESPKLFFDDSTGLSMGDLVSKCYKLAKEYNGLSLICVDYLQLMKTGNKAQNRTLEIAELTRQLKLMAKEFDCPVIALSQLNRGIEQRRESTPQLSDLRESGAIEQDADLILFITRDTQNPADRSANVYIAKNRNGETGMIPFVYEGEYFAFSEKIDSFSAYEEDLDNDPDDEK